MPKRRPRDIGTWAETQTVKVAKEHGFPMAMRLPLSGRLDKGDVLLNPGSGHPVYIEVKGGAKAKNASDNQIKKWLDEHQDAIGLAHMEFPLVSGFLVVQRERRSPGFWWAVRYEDTRVVFQWLQDALQGYSEVLAHWATLAEVYVPAPTADRDAYWGTRADIIQPGEE